MRTSVERLLAKSLPDTYFRNEAEVRVPKAPAWFLFIAFFAENSVLISVLIFFVYYFSRLATPTTTISPSILEGQDCLALNPKKSTVYYSKTHSENAQFASYNAKSQPCSDLLATTLNVCSDGKRLDFLQVLGVTNFNNSQYYSSGYFSFAPSTSGLTSVLTTLYSPSVSFPKPDMATTLSTFSAFKVSSGWNVFYGNASPPNQFSAYNLVDYNLPAWDERLADSAKNKIYSSTVDFDLSGSAAKSSIDWAASNVSSAVGALQTLQTAMYDSILYGLQTEATFNLPSGICVDSSGEYVYVADYANNLMRQIDVATGAVVDVGTSADPKFHGPNGCSIDPSGRYLYVADYDNSLIRRVDLLSDAVTSVGTSAAPAFRGPSGVSIDPSGRYLYVADYDNSLIRRVDLSSDAVTSVGTSAAPAFRGPSGVIVDSSGSYLYVADSRNNLVRHVDLSSGAVTSLGVGPSVVPEFNYPTGVSVDQAGTYLYIADSSNNRVRRLDLASGDVEDVGSSVTPSFSAPQGVAVSGKYLYIVDSGNNQIRRAETSLEGGAVTGIGSSAIPAFSVPKGLSVDSQGQYLYIADSGNHLVRRLDLASGAVTSVGTSASPPFNNPQGLSLDPSGAFLYIADSDNSMIRRVDLASGTVTSLGTSASPPFNKVAGVSVDQSGANLYIGDSNNNILRRLDLATGEVEEVGPSADPSFSYPIGLSGDPSGRFLYAADMINNLVRKIDLASGDVSMIAKAVSPSFAFPEAVSVSPSGQMLYIADSGNNIIRRVDIASGSVKSVGASASPSFNQPAGVAVDPSGQWLYVADTQNNLIRRVELVETVSNVALRFPPSAFSIDVSSSDSAASLTELPAISATSLPGVITADGSCEGVAEDRMCLSLVYSEFNAETSTLWLDLLNAAGYHFFQSTSSATASQPASPVVLFSSSSSRRALLAAIKTPLVADATVLFTTDGALSSSVKQGYPPLDVFPNFNALMSGKTLQDASKIPPSPLGSSTRYLLISAALSDDYQAVIYDTFTDTVVSSNKANAAPTHYMLAYSWGMCSGNVTRGLVELTFSNDYSNVCQLPSTGLYYQSENRYFSIPISCLGIAYDKLLTDCPEVKANMKSMVDSTCAASIPKVCQQQYETNPPFSCVADIFSSPLTVLSLAISNTLALTGFFSLLAAFVIRRFYSDFKASSEELEALNPTEELGVLVCSFFAAMCGRSSLKDNHHATEGKTAVASLEMARYKGENADAESDSSYSWSEIDTNSDDASRGEDAAGLRTRLEKQRAMGASSSYPPPNEASFGLIDSIVRGIIGQRPSPPAFFPQGPASPDEAQPLLEELSRTVSSLREEVKELRARQLDTEDVLVKTVVDPEALPKGRQYGRSPL